MKGLLLAAWIGGCGADAASTHVALTRGAHELILTQSPLGNDAIIAGQAVYGAWALERLYRRHPKLAIVVGISAGVFRASIATRNLRAARPLFERR